MNEMLGKTCQSLCRNLSYMGAHIRDRNYSFSMHQIESTGIKILLLGVGVPMCNRTSWSYLELEVKSSSGDIWGV